MQFLMLNSSSSHADNHKNNFVVWGEGPTCDINEIFGSIIMDIIFWDFW